MQSFSCDCSALRVEISIVMACSLGRQGESILITSPSILLAKWAGWVYIVGFVPKRKKSLFNLNKSFFDHFKYVQTRCLDFCIICSFSQREVEKSLSHLLDRSMKTASAVWQSISNSSVSVRSLVVSVRGVSQLWLILKYHWWISYYCDTIFLCQACPLLMLCFPGLPLLPGGLLGYSLRKKVRAYIIKRKGKIIT